MAGTNESKPDQPTNVGWFLHEHVESIPWDDFHLASAAPPQLPNELRVDFQAIRKMDICRVIQVPDWTELGRGTVVHTPTRSNIPDPAQRIPPPGGVRERARYFSVHMYATVRYGTYVRTHLLPSKIDQVLRTSLDH